VFKEKTSKAIDRYFHQGNNIFFKYISSQVMDAIILGIITGIVMWVMGIRYGALLALMLGVCNMIPVLGSIFATVVAAVMTVFTGGFSQGLTLLIVLIIIQQIDANIINPRLIGRVLKISPILTIFSVTVFGAYFGILGMFLAVPIIAVAKLIINDFIESRLEPKLKALKAPAKKKI
jgi:predicted PurR-regulated permease PerM